VIVYDRWGYGRSDPRPALDLPTFSTDVQDLYTILEQNAINTAALVGHSDGGSIALYCAARHPERICSLVTVAAHIYVEPKMVPGMLAIKKIFEQDEHFRVRLQHAHGAGFDRVFRLWFDSWYQTQLLAWDMRPVLSQIHCPVLVVQGDADEYAIPQHARDIAAAMDGAELWLVPGAGHMLPQEHAELFNPRLVQFLNTHRDR
jgi:pimeloyl-ACP methyl ester carboxylesterase